MTDPDESLPLARPEGLVVAFGLALQGWEVDPPKPAEVHGARIVDGLERASFFYYAGHAEHDVEDTEWGLLPPYAGGTEAWPARMLLRRDEKGGLHETLGMQDISMLEAAPRHVALIGCRTGVPPDMGGGMSLALAFLVAGTEEVVATPDETPDAVGMATGVRLLRGISGEDVSLAEGLQRAQAAMLRSGADVGRYRVWVR